MNSIHLIIPLLAFLVLFFQPVGFAHDEYPLEPAVQAKADESADLDKNQEETVAESEDEDTPVEHDEIAGDRNLTGTRPWRGPNFSKQDNVLGYSADMFSVPKGLEPNFQFWLDIYTKFTTDQGVLHDSENINLIYETLDFTAISGRTDISEGQKNRLRQKAVKEAKKRIADMLKKFDRIKNPEELDFNEKRIYDFFAVVDSKTKFKDALKKNRVRFQLGQRDRIMQGIFFSGRYLEEFETIFREAGLPIELTRLVFVESSFNVLARSKVGASGLWQIMRYTGRPHMMINSAIDKRNHPTEATKLATKLMKQNFEMLQSWPLAVTGYNHGPSGVLRLTRKNKTRDLAEMVLDQSAKHRLGFASRNFYMSFLAALEAEKNAPQYFGKVLWSEPLKSKDLTLYQAVQYKDILRWFEGNDEKAQIFNPHITSSARKFGRQIPKGAIISIPLVKEQEVLADIEKMKTDKSYGKEESLRESSKNYKVVRGDTLTSISRDFGISPKEIIRANDSIDPHHLRVGQSITIP